MVETGREWQSQLLWFLGRNAEQTKISTCFPNVFHFQDEFIAAAMDPDDQMEWFHYHLQKCYTPYMDAVGCVVNVGDKEIQSMKKEAGPEGWSAIQQKFIQDAARTAGETKARMMWEMATNMKEIHEKTRQRDGHLFGEKSSTPPPLSNNNNNVSRASTPSTLNDVAEAMGVSEYLYNKNNGPPTKQSHLEVEEMFRFAREQEVKQQMKEAIEKEKKPFWRFGFWTNSTTKINKQPIEQCRIFYCG